MVADSGMTKIGGTGGSRKPGGVYAVVGEPVSAWRADRSRRPHDEGDLIQ